MLSAPEAKYILEHSGATTLCVDSEFVDLGRTAGQETDVNELFWLPNETAEDSAEAITTFDDLLKAERAPQRSLAGSMLVQIVYTSGTESRPKGVMLTHDAIISEYVTCLVDAAIRENDRVLHDLPLYHCAQLDVFLGSRVYVGATNVITSKPRRTTC